MGLKKKERHPLRKIKELFSKVGTLNLILIIVGAFLCGSTGRCFASIVSMRPFRRHTPAP